MTSAGVLMLMLSKPLIRLTPLYSGILSKWTMLLEVPTDDAAAVLPRWRGRRGGRRWPILA